MSRNDANNDCSGVKQEELPFIQRNLKKGENETCSNNQHMCSLHGRLKDEPDLGKCNEPNNEVIIEDESTKLIYKISDRPPFQSTLIFAFQNLLLALPWNVTTAILVAEVTCARDDQEIKATLLSTTIFMSGLTTLAQVTFGVRIPVYQGPTTAYIIPLLAMASLDEWKCVYSSGGLNTTHPFIDEMGNATASNISFSPETEHRENVILPRLQLMQGTLIVVGIAHALVGITGTVGVLMKFVGPITIIPTILLIGLAIYQVFSKFAGMHWGISGITFTISLILCLYLAGKKLPTPVWTRGRGFHIILYPIQQVLSMLITILVGWGIAGIFTAAGILTDDKTQPGYGARTDARSHVIHTTPWFYVPYPGQFGKFGFNPGLLVAFLTATLTSIIDSIGDYYACARMSRIPPPPVHAVNRGIGVEGLMCAVSGMFGTGHGTTTFGGHIGSIGVTRVASRFVYQTFAIIMLLVAIIGKVGAVFVTIPYPVLGGAQIIGLGMFIGLVMSNMQYIDMQSTRNLAIIGVSIMVGLMIPHWAKTNQKDLETGYQELDGFIKTIMTNPNLAGGLLACFLDNTVPGTLKERGMIGWSSGGISDDNDHSQFEYEEGLDVYDLPYLSKILGHIKFLKYIPFSPTYNRHKS